MNKLLILSMIILALACVAVQADLLVDFNPAGQIGHPLTTITFNVTITNSGSSIVYLNGVGFAYKENKLLSDLSLFRRNVPASLSPGQSWTGDVFEVYIDGNDILMNYLGNLVVMGGTESGSQDVLKSTSFLVTVASPPTITSLTPDRGANSGCIDIANLAGTGFLSGIEVKLSKSGESDIIATNVLVVSSTQITCTFDLTGKIAGVWNVVVTNPDGQSGTLVDGFTVVAEYTLSAIVNLGNYSGTIADVPVKLDLLTEDGLLNLRTVNTFLDINGKFYLHNVEPGKYKIGIKPSHWLRKVTGPVEVIDSDVLFVIQ